MNKKTLLGLIVFVCLVTTGLLIGANHFINQENTVYTKDNSDNADTQQQAIGTQENVTDNSKDDTDNGEASATVDQMSDTNQKNVAGSSDVLAQEPWLLSNPSDTGKASENGTGEGSQSTAADTLIESGMEKEETIESSSLTTDALSESLIPQLILDSDEVDYKAYIPEMVIDSQLEVALDITNPDIVVDAKAAILFDANTKEVLYYKDAVEAVFPASTAKLLTSVVALKWCKPDEEVTIGDEIKMMASDSTRAYLCKGQVLTVQDLLTAMLLPSGNDAAYAMAAYVGKKSLQNMESTNEEAIPEFIRLMNLEAVSLGAKNSCFKTPDGYDAIGQYTTAYDMGLIGAAASEYKTIIEITKQSCSRNIFPSGEDVTFYNTNKLITKYSGQYYSNAIGLKTGTSTMAGRCIIAAAEKDGKKVVCAIMDSSSAGRWEDAIKLLKYGLE